MTFVFTSVTYALKAQRILASNRVYTTLTRSPAVTAVRGCGYGLKLADESQQSQAMALLSKAGVGVVGAVKE